MAVNRKVEYSNGKTKFNGYFHTWLIGKQENGGEYAKALIEDEEGFMIEVKNDMMKFISEEEIYLSELRKVSYKVYNRPFSGWNREVIKEEFTIKEGYFHLWEKSYDQFNRDSEEVCAIIEDAETGAIRKINPVNIEFTK